MAEPGGGSFSLETLGHILLRVESDVTELREGFKDLADQKGKLSSGVSILRWILAGVFTVAMSGGGYLLATVNNHSDRLTTLEANEKNADKDSTKQETKMGVVEQKAAAVPQLTDEVANLTKAVSDRSSDVEKMKDEVSQEQDQIGKLTHRVSGAEDDITLLKARPTPKAH